MDNIFNKGQAESESMTLNSQRTDQDTFDEQSQYQGNNFFTSQLVQREQGYSMLKSKIIPKQYSVICPRPENKKPKKKPQNMVESTLVDVLLLQNRDEQDYNKNKQFFISKKTMQELQKDVEKEANFNGMESLNNHYIRFLHYDRMRTKFDNVSQNVRNNIQNKSNVKRMQLQNQLRKKEEEMRKKEEELRKQEEILKKDGQIQQNYEAFKKLDYRGKIRDIFSLESFRWNDDFLDNYKKQLKLRPLNKSNTQQLKNTKEIDIEQKEKYIKQYDFEVRRHSKSMHFDSRRVSVEEEDLEKIKRKKLQQEQSDFCVNLSNTPIHNFKQSIKEEFIYGNPHLQNQSLQQQGQHRRNNTHSGFDSKQGFYNLNGKQSTLQQQGSNILQQFQQQQNNSNKKKDSKYQVRIRKRNIRSCTDVNGSLNKIGSSSKVNYNNVENMINNYNYNYNNGHNNNSKESYSDRIDSQQLKLNLKQIRFQQKQLME